MYRNAERKEGLCIVKSLVARVTCTNKLLGAGSQMRYMASSATPVLVQGRTTDTAPAEQGAAGSLSISDEQGNTAQASNQV